MRVAILGGAGAMASTIVRDLSENPDVEEVLVADYREEAAIKYASSFNDPRIKGSFVDARDVEKTAELIRGYDVLVNSAQHYFNIPAMQSSLKAKCHYTDLGGLFHVTLEQMKLASEFERAGLIAVICMGSAPGITNILARYAYDQLDTVERVILCDAGVDMSDMKGVDVFKPPYSIRTIMSEFADDAMMYKDGEFRVVPPLVSALEISFPEPIGKRTCIQTLHSEPATIPASFKDKGVKEVIWCLSLPYEVEVKSKFLATLGFDRDQPIKVGDVEVAPLDVLAAVIENHVTEKCSGVEFDLNDLECLRAQVTGTKDGESVEYIADCLVRTHSKWGCSGGDLCTGVPPSIVAQMLAGGELKRPGVWAPEQAIEPLSFFKALAQREMKVNVAVYKELA